MPQYTDSNGYIMVKRPDITTSKKGYIGEHRAVWIDNHGAIPDGAVIHHINGDKMDNRIENLQLYENNGQYRHECHLDLSWLAPDQPRLEPFDLVDMMFIRSHLPLDRL